MKLILPFLFLMSSIAYGHEYFFGFAEIEYNETSRKFECTLTFSTEDIDQVFYEHGVISDLSNSANSNNVERYLNSHFQVIVGKWTLPNFVDTNNLVKFNLIGSDKSLNGTTNFFLESESVDMKPEIQLSFDLLMNTFKQQQNKITFKYKNRTYTKTFLYPEHIHLISIENK